MNKYVRILTVFTSVIAISASSLAQEKKEESFGIDLLRLASWVSFTADVALSQATDKVDRGARLAEGLQKNALGIRTILEMTVERNSILGLKLRSNYTDDDLMTFAFEGRLAETIDCGTVSDSNLESSRTKLQELGILVEIDSLKDAKIKVLRSCMNTKAKLRSAFGYLTEAVLKLNMAENYGAKYHKALVADVVFGKISLIVLGQLYAGSKGALALLPLEVREGLVAIVGGHRDMLNRLVQLTFVQNAKAEATALKATAYMVAGKLANTLSIPIRTNSEDSIYWAGRSMAGHVSNYPNQIYAKSIDEVIPTNFPDAIRTYLSQNSDHFRLTHYGFSMDRLFLKFRFFNERSSFARSFRWDASHSASLVLTKDKAIVRLLGDSEKELHQLWHLIKENPNVFHYLKNNSLDASFEMPLEFLPRLIQDMRTAFGYTFT